MTLIDDIIRDIHSTLLKSNNFLLNSKRIGRRHSTNIISSFSGPYRYISVESYLDDFCNIIRETSYICQFEDGSVITGLYDFQNVNELSDATLCYIPNPNLVIDEIYLNEDQEENESDDLSHIMNYIRMDLNRESYREILHPCTHIHFSLSNENRICVSSMPLFSQFFNFILYLFYRRNWIEYNELELVDDNNYDYTEYIRRVGELRHNNLITNAISDSEMHHIRIEF